jgi:hypothetical protein
MTVQWGNPDHQKEQAMRKKVVPSLISLALISIFSIPQIAADTQVNTTDAYFQCNPSGIDGIEACIISGPPQPPAGVERQSVSFPAPFSAAGVANLSVPAFNWFMGCSATSGAMIASYWDRNGFPNMYTGPANGGVMPMDNSSWPTWMDGAGTTYGQCPLTASHSGLDGRVTRGSIDDYWIQYNSGAEDPFVTNGWTEHTWGDAIGDYMKTSQHAYENNDGSTAFYTFTSSASQLTCSLMEGYGISARDGTYGRKLFYQAKGYTVTDCYNQKTDNTIAGGFSFAQFQAEINAGRPVMLNLEGHTIVGVGYDTSTNAVIIHDTWDYLDHSMTWGASYAGMPLMSVSIVNLEPPATFTLTVDITGSGMVTRSNPGPYYLGDVVDLWPYPFEGWSFSAWSGACTGSGACSVTMDADKTVGATFTQDEYSLTVDVTGSGTVTRSSPGPYHLNDVVDLTPVPDDGWSFSAWSGACTGFGACSVTMDADKTVGAAFLPDCHTLTETHTGSGGDPTALPANSVGCATGKYQSGESIALTAGPAAGWTVDSWNGTNDDAGTSTTNSVTMPSSDWTVTVNYARQSCLLSGLPLYDFNGDCSTDIAVYRPATGAWYFRGQTSVSFGTLNDKPAPGDYNGDGTTDIAVYRPSTGAWYIRGQSSVSYGAAGDIPVPGDYTGDGTTDIAVYRPSTGAWYIRGQSSVSYGAPGDIPIPGDYTGDGTTDIAVYRPSTGAWYVRGQTSVRYGAPTDIPVPGDYNGDGTTDIAVYRPATGAWYIRGQSSVSYGASGDIPIPGDYNGDGTTDIAVFRPATGAWYIRGQTAVAYGASGDIPLPELSTGKASTAP